MSSWYNNTQFRLFMSVHCNITSKRVNPACLLWCFLVVLILTCVICAVLDRFIARKAGCNLL
jgi:hypothetical protein